MNSLHILYFGSIRDITGTSSEHLSHAGTLSELISVLKTHYPGIQGTRFQVSINRQLIRTDELQSDTLRPSDGDEIALLPPFAGG